MYLLNRKRIKLKVKKGAIVGAFMFVACVAKSQCDFILEFLPGGWQGMEIEAKWESNSQTYDQIVADFIEDQYFEGYKIDVRWGGISRKYVDYYYDDGSNTLSDNKHSLRWRTRSSSNASSNSITALRNATWSENWQKVQYKSTPYRYGAVWLREETGDCKIDDYECLCNNITQIMNGTCNPQHVAISTLLDEQPGFNFATNAQIDMVVDYRYRIELEKYGVGYYEISLDRIDHGSYIEYEVELEMIKDNYTSADLSELFRLVHILESTPSYSLTPSTVSKGGIPIPEDQWDKTIADDYISGDFTGKARNNIYVNNVDFTSTSDVELIAGNQIRLGTGTVIAKNSTFIARISDCPGGQLKNAHLSEPENYQPISRLDNNMNSKKESLELNLYPNPTKGILNVELTGSNGIEDEDMKLVNVTVINVLGEKVYGSVFNNEEIQVDISHLDDGMYIIQVSTNNNEFVVEEFLKY